MRILTYDIETYWSVDFSLSKMTPFEYVMGDQFELISVALKWDNEPTEVYFGQVAEHKMKSLVDDVANAAVVAHNGNGFDHIYAAWVCGWKPKAWFDTMAMARPRHAKSPGIGLAKLSEHYGLAEKNNAILLNTKGKRYKDFGLSELEAMGKYNKGDTDNTKTLFDILVKQFDKTELKTIDLTARMIVEPALELDLPLLRAELEQVRIDKRQALICVAAQCLDQPHFDLTLAQNNDDHILEATRKVLASNEKFAELLRKHGVEPELKDSKTSVDADGLPKQTYAFAKTDEFMDRLMEHENLDVQALAEARLGVKSTILETRLATFIRVGELVPSNRMPFTLHYCGADTTGRWSGFAYNPQNLTRGSAMRRAIRAPQGRKLAVADLSAIELRVNHVLAGVVDTIERFKSDPVADLYKAFATSLYNVPEKDVTKQQRQTAKIAQLGLGYGMGAVKFQETLRQWGIDVTAEEAKTIVDKWRNHYDAIVKLWRRAGDLIPYMLTDHVQTLDPAGLVTTTRNGWRLPSGRTIYYPHLRQEANSAGKMEWVYGEGRHKAKLYGGKAIENVVQAISRDIMRDHALEINKIEPVVGLVHDEAICCPLEHEAEWVLEEMLAVMRTAPKWWPDIILWAAGDIAGNYAEAK